MDLEETHEIIVNKEKEDTIQAMELLNKFITDEYKKLESKETSYITVAEKLEIYFEKRINEANIEKNVLAITHKITELQDDIELSKGIEKEVDSEVSTDKNNLKQINDKISLCNEISKELPSIRQMYAKQAMDEIRKSLYVKIQTLIRNEKVNKLYAQKDAMQNSKTTVLEKVFGKNKLKNEQIRFIELQIKSLTEQPIAKKEQYSVKDSLAEMRAFVIANNENNTQEIEQLETNIYQIFGGFTREEVEELAKIKSKLNSNLPVPVEEKLGLFQIRVEVKQLRRQNDIIDEEIQTNIQKSNMPVDIQERQDAITIFKNKLQSIENVMHG